jgi:hypothetical protein
MQIKPNTSCAVCLRIGIHKQRFHFQYGQACRQVDGSSGFSHSSLLIRYPDYSGHGSSSSFFYL